MSKTKITSGAALLSYFQRVAKELGATNSQRLLRLAEIEAETDQRYRFDKVFDVLFKDEIKSKAQESFKKFRTSVNDASLAAKCSLRILIDKSRSGDLTQRYFWFEVDPADNPELNEFADRARRQGDAATGHQRSMALASRPTYEIFISYASTNKKQADALLKLLAPPLATSVWPHSADIQHA